jgi:hypothetical protein
LLLNPAESSVNIAAKIPAKMRRSPPKRPRLQNLHGPDGVPVQNLLSVDDQAGGAIRPPQRECMEVQY